MCIFAAPVDDVHATKIVTGVHDDQLQWVVYKNVVGYKASKEKKEQANAMILPIPCDAKDVVVPEALNTVSSEKEGSEKEGSWGDQMLELCAKMDWKDPEQTLSFSFGVAQASVAKSIEIKTIGCYKLCVAPTLDDVKKVAADGHFVISDAALATLQKHYQSPFPEKKGFCFLVASFIEGKAFHALTYYHSLPVTIRTSRVGDFPEKRLFVPTRHEHGPSPKGDVVDKRNGRDIHKFDLELFYVAPVQNKGKFYFQNKVRPFAPQYVAKPNGTVVTFVKNLIATFGEAKKPVRKDVYRVDAKGLYVNSDIWVPVDVTATVSSKEESGIRGWSIADLDQGGAPLYPISEDELEPLPPISAFTWKDKFGQVLRCPGDDEISPVPQDFDGDDQNVHYLGRVAFTQD